MRLKNSGKGRPGSVKFQDLRIYLSTFLSYIKFLDQLALKVLNVCPVESFLVKLREVFENR